LFNSKNDFKRLYMKPSQTFHEFYTQFLHLSSKAQIVLSELKYELYQKLTLDLQRQVMV
jgi:hypothetical protein